MAGEERQEGAITEEELLRADALVAAQNMVSAVEGIAASYTGMDRSLSVGATVGGAAGGLLGGAIGTAVTGGRHDDNALRRIKRAAQWWEKLSTSLLELELSEPEAPPIPDSAHDDLLAAWSDLSRSMHSEKKIVRACNRIVGVLDGILARLEPTVSAAAVEVVGPFGRRRDGIEPQEVKGHLSTAGKVARRRQASKARTMVLLFWILLACAAAGTWYFLK